MSIPQSYINGWQSNHDHSHNRHELKVYQPELITKQQVCKPSWLLALLQVITHHKFRLQINKFSHS